MTGSVVMQVVLSRHFLLFDFSRSIEFYMCIFFITKTKQSSHAPIYFRSNAIKPTCVDFSMCALTCVLIYSAAGLQ